MKRLLKFLLTVTVLIVLTQEVSAQDKLYPNTFPLRDIQLFDSPFKSACDLNIEVLLQYETDRFLAPFLREAGLPAKKPSYGNWEKDGLDGHIGGHYLTALAIHYAATGNRECKDRMDYMVSELKRCQDKNGNGYIGGIPKGDSLWTEIKKGNTGIIWKYWVPWYNMHKTYAGLRDAWVYGGNEKAKQMFLDLCDWGLTVIAPLNDSQMEGMLANEFGGMNEVYADAYQITGDAKYLNAAKRFSHKDLFESMAVRVDNLDNKHANTQVPKAVGYQRVAELGKDENYTTAANFFWETVVNNRSLSLGGNSRREHFPTAADCKNYAEEREGPESCNTNNMLKLTEGLFRMNPQAKYADFYERAMFNHILSTQHPEHGGYVYFTPARPAHYRVYSAPNSAMWCCVGTGMENHGKYGEFIYSHTHDSLFVNLFVASELTWKEKNITLTQNTRFPDEENSKLTVKVSAPTKFKLLVRHPAWVAASDMQVVCNGVNYVAGSSPSSYIAIDRTWKNGDVVEISVPMKVSIEEMPNTPNYISILRGPILLGAKTGTENLHGLVANDDRWAHIAGGPLVSAFEAPYIIGERTEILSKLNAMQPIAGKPFSYTVPELFARYKDLVLEPFYRIHDSRYAMYWLSMTDAEFEKFKYEMGEDERTKLILDERTIDAVATGEQQPEADHRIETRNSNTGIHEGEVWRDARNGGYFQYNLPTRGHEEGLSLMVRYWGNDGGNRTFDILIDNKPFITENIAGKWNKSEFVNVEYPIPAKMLKGKESITVRFQAKE
ncbi:MAG: glycoside hydrolase family 127 protein, partial [Tannerella sp.]|nr:glycoside hydrolase family 127 protein [Tannerella sp.]